MTATDTSTAFAVGDRVVVTRNIPGVPEGTAGKVRLANGFSWLRYWVDFDNGAWVGSVSGDHLVAERDWDDFQRRRAEEASRPKEAPKPAAEAAPAAESGGGSTGGVPAHLLERSKAARAKKAAG